MKHSFICCNNQSLVRGPNMALEQVYTMLTLPDDFMSPGYNGVVCMMLNWENSVLCYFAVIKQAENLV